MSKTFKVVGVSKLNGKYKVRFANDMLRVKVLEKNGHKDVDLVELVHPMTKEDAVRKLIEMDFAKGDAAVQAALDEALDKRAEKPAKEPKAKAPKAVKKATPKADAVKAKAAVKAAKDKVAKPTKAEIEAQLADAEDAPF